MEMQKYGESSRISEDEMYFETYEDMENDTQNSDVPERNTEQSLREDQ